jgi:hypothetical protein
LQLKEETALLSGRNFVLQLVEGNAVDEFPHRDIRALAGDEPRNSDSRVSEMSVNEV